MTSIEGNKLYECALRYPVLRSRGVRAGLFFFNFYLIITALYQLKPASRSLFIEFVGAAHLPYVWIAVALAMGLFISVYDRLVSRFSRRHVVMATTLIFGVILLAFRIWFFFPGKAAASCFYIFEDIQSVVLVEQFWSLANSVYSTREGKSWYGFVGTGGLLGGITGGGISALLIRYTHFTTYDLLISAAITLFLIFTLTLIMGRLGLFCEVDDTGPDKEGASVEPKTDFKPYLILIAAILLLSQLVSPIIQYQFLNAVEKSYPHVEARTAFLGMFFSLLSTVAITVNLIVTPFVHRVFGPIAGLLAQPLAIIVFSGLFLFNPTLFFAGATNIGDRGLSYSINRASKELLYVPIGSLLIYRAKAWIDMLGYRLFKVVGSVLILIVAALVHSRTRVFYLTLTTMLVCGIWLVLIGCIRTHYRMLKLTF